MPNDCTPKLKALADDTRRHMVARLALAGAANVTTLQEAAHISQPSASKHLRILRTAGIVSCEREGTTAWYQIVPEFLRPLGEGESLVDFGCCSFHFSSAEAV